MLKRMTHAAWAQRPLGILAVSLGFLVSPAGAQDAASRRPRVTLSASFGYMAGGPAKGIEAMLEAGGFGSFMEGGCQIEGCFVDRDYPVTASDPGPGSNLRVSYSQWRRFEVAVSTGSATPSETDGFSEVLVPDFGRYSTMGSHLRIFASTANLRAGFASIGIGPAYYRLRTWAGSEDEQIDEATVSKVGALLEAAGQFPMFKKVILDLRLHYRYVGSTEVGPLQLASRTLPATRVDFSHAFFGIGLGLAF